jgi:hypothetical protein
MPLPMVPRESFPGVRGSICQSKVRVTIDINGIAIIEYENNCNTSYSLNVYRTSRREIELSGSCDISDSSKEAF